jgi:hypothetical protein
MKYFLLLGNVKNTSKAEKLAKTFKSKTKSFKHGCQYIKYQRAVCTKQAYGAWRLVKPHLHWKNVTEKIPSTKAVAAALVPCSPIGLFPYASAIRVANVYGALVHKINVIGTTMVNTDIQVKFVSCQRLYF